MIELLFLGSGSAFTVGADNYHSNLLLIDSEKNKLLIDCGSDIRFSLYEAGFSHLDITDIYISHLHADHVGGLEYIGFTTLFNPQCSRPNLYTSEDVGQDLWQKTLAGGMEAISGKSATLETYFNPHFIANTGSFQWQRFTFQLVQVIHILTDEYLMPSYGLFVDIAGVKVFLTTDTQLHLDTNRDYYEAADIIFHDCETSQFPSPVHVHYQELRQLPLYIKQKMWLYGYQPGKLPNAQQDDFLGFVKKGQRFGFEQAKMYLLDY
ncbi:MBL fold metallo-hydrolase [Spirulina subsalsa FACHB-351]|uniref:MBL fold metallo-hydrolase n=1 Tax=Spirulina subsalsa FACHB-351 TaxID=234711 RepID=A0ABT3L9A3_9CYAN|nr:MBL fold metallo-hydrolase [Spirulina subsalsa]MCW6037540.1 MBL fold metallo-hydrolase [Spirulina subsalsa FACHB-351]